jgi:hypothetical protein
VLADKTPRAISDLTEVITSACHSEFDPNLVCVTTTTGQATIVDQRIST